MADKGQQMFEKFMKKSAGKGAGIGMFAAVSAGATLYALYNSVYTGFF